MKKKLLCLILAVVIMICSLPLSVLAEELAKNTPPMVSVKSQHSYPGGTEGEFRALPDQSGNFYFDISLSKAPQTDEAIRVYYRTVDDSAVAKWGDYESVGVAEDAYVILSKENGYKARVVVRSTILDDAFIGGTDFSYNQNEIVSRRFIFEL